MTDDRIFDDAAGVLAQRAGLRTTQATRARLESSVRLRASGCGMSIERYVDNLRRQPAEVQLLIDGLTVQETSFFRDSAHIDALLWHIVPHRPGPVVVWSAGCATGQEPYSIAMALEEAKVPDWRIVATDLSRPAVERTREGLYGESELRGLSAARRGRYLRREGLMWRMDDRLRERVTVSHHNLLTDPVPLSGTEATAVFCRNVFIYLQRESITGFLGRLTPHLSPGGVLFVGASESLWQVPAGFSLVQLGGAFAYRRDGPDRSEPEPRPSPQPLVLPIDPPAVAEPAPVAVLTVAPCAEGNEAERTAVEQFRREAYLDPDDPVAHLQLGLSLEAAGDDNAGRRAFRAALAALDRTDESIVETRLEGYTVGALRTMLDAKLAGGERR